MEEKLKKQTILQINQVLQTKELTIERVCFFMQQIRLLIEINNQKDKYKITNHYCNWLLHRNLDKSQSPTIIKNIALSFEHANNKNDLIIRISEVLSLIKLVKEIRQFLSENIEDKNFVLNSVAFISDEYWINFIEIILNQLQNRPLLIGKPIRISWLGDDSIDAFFIKGVQLSNNKNKIVLEILSNNLEARDKRFFIDIVLFKKSEIN